MILNTIIQLHNRPVLIEWDNNALCVCGVPILPDSTHFYLGCECWHQYQRVIDHGLYRQYIEVIPGDKTIKITQSPFGEWPLTYHISPGCCFIDPSPEKVRQALLQKGVEVKPDRVGILEGMIFDIPFRNRTLFKGVHKVIAGDRLQLSIDSGRVERTSKWILPFTTSSHNGKTTADLIDEGCYILSRLIKDAYIPPSVREKSSDVIITLPLSSGLDSRLLLAALAEKGANLKTFTFGTKKSIEFTLASQLANISGVSWEKFELTEEEQLRGGEEVVKLTGGMSYSYHSHLFSAMLRTSYTHSLLYHGFLGGEYAGAAQPVDLQEYGSEKETALNQFVKKNFARHPLWQIMGSALQDEICEDILAVLEDCCQVNPPWFLDEYIHNVDRQFGLIAWVFCLSELYAPCIRPFANMDYAIFFNSLPFELRKDRMLYRKGAGTLFPELFQVREQLHPYPHWVNVNLQRNLIRASMKLQYYSDFLTAGKLTVHSPHSGPNWFGELRRQHKTLVRQLDRAMEILDIDLSMYESYFYRVHDRNVTAPLRILSLGLIF